MRQFVTLPGVAKAETGGPDGNLITVEQGKTFATGDDRVASVLLEHLGHAVEEVFGQVEHAVEKVEAAVEPVLAAAKRLRPEPPATLPDPDAAPVAVTEEPST